MYAAFYINPKAKDKNQRVVIIRPYVKQPSIALIVLKSARRKDLTGGILAATEEKLDAIVKAIEEVDEKWPDDLQIIMQKISDITDNMKGKVFFQQNLNDDPSFANVNFGLDALLDEANAVREEMIAKITASSLFRHTSPVIEQTLLLTQSPNALGLSVPKGVKGRTATGGYSFPTYSNRGMLAQIMQTQFLAPKNPKTLSSDLLNYMFKKEAAKFDSASSFANEEKFNALVVSAASGDSVFERVLFHQELPFGAVLKIIVAHNTQVHDRLVIQSKLVLPIGSFVDNSTEIVLNTALAGMVTVDNKVVAYDIFSPQRMSRAATTVPTIDGISYINTNEVAGKVVEEVLGLLFTKTEKYYAALLIPNEPNGFIMFGCKKDVSDVTAGLELYKKHKERKEAPAEGEEVEMPKAGDVKFFRFRR